jgi:hypothetical protein
MSDQLPTRRDFAGLAAAAALGVGAQSLAAQASDPPQLRSEFLMNFGIELDGPGKGRQDIGHLGATLSGVAVTGGWFEGPKLKGRLVPPGADWAIRRADDSVLLDLRMTMHTEDGANILMAYRGVNYAPKNGPAYRRITMTFETGVERYAWLNNIVTVGVPTVMSPPAYRVYQIL